MSQTPIAATAEAEIPRSFLEYTLVFETAILKAWEHRAVVISDVLAALKSHGFHLDGVEIKFKSEKVNEHAIVFRRTVPASPPVSVTLFLGKILIAAENLDWSDADTFIATATVALDAIHASTQCTVLSQHIGLGLHIQVKNKSIKDVTASLISPASQSLLNGDVTFSGVAIAYAKSSINIDTSQLYANTLWVRMFREHSGLATLPEIAQILRKDEEQLFRVLALEGNL